MTPLPRGSTTVVITEMSSLRPSHIAPDSFPRRPADRTPSSVRWRAAAGMSHREIGGYGPNRLLLRARRDLLDQVESGVVLVAQQLPQGLGEVCDAVAGIGQEELMRVAIAVV